MSNVSDGYPGQADAQLQARLAQATQLHGAGRFDEASAIYNDILSAAPRSVDALRLLGTLQIQRGQLEDGVRLLDSSLAVNPNQADVVYNRGVALQGMGRLGDALGSYDAAIALNPAYAEAYNNRSLTLHQLNRFDEALAASERAIALRPDFASAHNNRGLALQSLQRIQEALASYDQAVAINPRHIEAHNNRGVILQSLKQNDAALAAFRRVVELDPGNAAARHLVAALSGSTPRSAPPEYVGKLFDDYAESFDRHLKEELQYQTPTKMRAVFDRMVPAGLKAERTLDLGCGTGLSGEAFRDVAGHLTGVDLSREMLAKAAAKNIYQTLLEGDLNLAIEAQTEPVALFLAADVFVYVGELNDVFARIASKSAQGTLFCFSIETNDGPQDYVLRDTGRFAHSRIYIARLAAAYGFGIAAADDTELRVDKTGPIMGTIFLMQKRA